MMTHQRIARTWGRCFLHGSLLFLVQTAGLAQDALVPAAKDPYETLYNTIMVRQTPDGKSVGANEMTPLLWVNSRTLIRDPGYGRFIKALDAFTDLTNEELEAYGPVKRALLQRHLWAVFDWTTTLTQYSWIPQSKFDTARQSTLQQKLAPLIKRLALSKEQIAKLPDTISATAKSGRFPEKCDPADPFKPFFPSGLFDEKGPWVCLSRTYHTIPAKAHTESDLWRSVFQVFIRLPGDREETLGYIKKLAEFPDHWVTEKPEPRIIGRTTPNGGINYVDIYVNPKTPQFPVGTQFALVEQALLISDTGELVGSPLSFSAQFRAYLQVDLEIDRKKPVQAFAEFVAQPHQLMQGKAEMRAIGSKEYRYKTLSTGSDPLQSPAEPNHGRLPSLKMCIHCHSAWGIHSVNTRSQLFELRNLLPPRLKSIEPKAATDATIRAKQANYSWGLLQGLWQRG